jgi:urease accessory protein
MKKFRILVLFALAALPATAEAHTGIGLHVHGFWAGIAHPLSGLDHLLAMTAVGFWAASLGGRARYIVPLAFMAVMTIGGVIGMMGLSFPMVETIIAASVVGLGALVALNIKLSTPIAAMIVGVCALFHGHAHGAELPAIASPLTYVAGFLMATGILHALGLGLGLLRFGKTGEIAARVAGSFVAIAGVALLTA